MAASLLMAQQYSKTVEKQPDRRNDFWTWDSVKNKDTLTRWIWFPYCFLENSAGGILLKNKKLTENSPR